MVDLDHSTVTGTDLHEDKRIKIPVRAASTANIGLSTPGASIDGVALTLGDRVLLKNQTTTSQNGVYVWAAAASPLTRASDAAAAADFVYGFKLFVREGTVNAKTYWTFTQTAALTLETTALTFVGDTTASSVFAGEVQGTDFKATGLTGATTGTRYVGATAGGPPASGTFLLGDVVVDDSAQGGFWTCVTGGTPGTWVRMMQNPMTVVGDIVIGGTVANGVAAPVRLPAGGALTVFTSNGAGVAPSWQAPTGGGGGGTGGTGGSIVPIQTQAPTGSSASFAVPAGFKNLRVTGRARSSIAATSDSLCMQFNGDAGSNYLSQEVSGAGSSAAAGELLTQSNLKIGNTSGSTSTSGDAGVFNIEIPDHTNTAYNKQVAATSFQRRTSSSGQSFIELHGGQWNSTAAITLITLLLPSGSTFAAGTTFTLWGEADTGPVLLTSNSNLIAEIDLTLTQAIMNIPQGYRDLLLIVEGRGTNATTFVNLLAQFNADATAGNYESASWQSTSTASALAEQLAAATTGLLGAINGASAPASAPSTVFIHIPAYTGVTLHKSWRSDSFVELSTATGDSRSISSGGRWKSTAAITQLVLSLSAGAFAAGSVARLYGEPSAAAGSSVGTGTRLRISGNQSIPNSAATAVTWDTEDQDADNQHYPSAANLTGTVAKTSGSANLVGTSTLFTTELSVGQVISVPGTAAEVAVVINIVDATHLTVAANFANTASGQTAARVNSAVIFRQPGMFTVELGAYMAAVSTGAVTVQIRLNGSTIIGQADKGAINASAGYDLVIQRPFQQWDYVEALVTQASGGAVNLTADERTHLSIQARSTVIVAIPYVCIQDQKTSGTAGGTFTSGADQTRTLNTVVSDSAGLVSLASNQFTLPPGTYRIAARAPAALADRHQAWLQNVTDATTILRGSSCFASASGNGAGDSIVSGRFTIAASKAFEIRHRAQTTSATNGFGVPGSFGIEVYTSVELWKEA